jgi:hypothetical protein
MALAYSMCQELDNVDKNPHNGSMEPSPTQHTPVTSVPPFSTAHQSTKKGFSKGILVFAAGGILASLLIVFLVPSLFSSPSPSLFTETQQEKPAPELTLSLESPSDGVLSVNNEVVVRGTTTPGSTVTIVTESDDAIVEPDVYGIFETTVKLLPGINSLMVTAYASDGQEQSTTLTIIHDTEV